MAMGELKNRSLKGQETKYGSWQTWIRHCLRYHQLIVVLGVVLVVQVLELILLQRKYDLFTGGFLEPYSYQDLGSRILFMGLSLGYDLFLFGFAGFGWFSLFNRFSKNTLVVSYNFLMLGIFGVGGWLAIKFMVFSYFADTLNFVVIRNLAGGSLLNGLLYISDESFVVVITVVGVIALYALGLMLVRKLPAQENLGRCCPTHRVALFWGLSFIVIAFTTLYVNTDPRLRHGVSKKTSFFIVVNVLDTLSDFDGDGYGYFRYLKDPAPFNPRIFPGALDLPGNGIDEDGYAGDAVAVPLPPDPFLTIPPAKGKHIILIVLESARGELLDAKINGRYVAPIIRTIAERGTSLAIAYSHTGYTTSSIKAIFNRVFYEEGQTKKISLMAYLKSAGYQFSFISGQDESFGGIDAAVGMTDPNVYLFDARSAPEDRVFFSAVPASARLSEERVAEQFRRRSKEVDWTVPQFMYLNFQAAHFPYAYPNIRRFVTDNLIPRSKINENNKAWLATTYWNAITNADWAIGEVMNTLKQKEVYDQTVVCILGDHGEELFDHGFLGHGYSLNEQQTRIPLIINQPGIVIDQAIGQTDVAEFVIRVALGKSIQWVDKDRRVFQVIGSLDEPQLIGYVQSHERRTILDLRTRQIFFSDLKAWKSFDDAYNDPVYRDQATTLIRAWETLRLEEHGLL